VFGWLPAQVVVVNTLLAESLLLLAIYLVVVRRAERRRRAVAIFLGGVAVLVTLESLAFVELALSPLRRSAVFVYDRFPDQAAHPRNRFARFHFTWLETRVLHRETERNLVIDEQRDGDALWIDMTVREGLEVRFADGGTCGGPVPPELWAFHDRAEDGGRALWETLRASSLATRTPEMERFVGKR